MNGRRPDVVTESDDESVRVHQGAWLPRRWTIETGVRPTHPDGVSSSPSLSREPALAPLYEGAPSETTPVLLELARRQVARRRAADLVAQLKRDLFVRPSALDLRLVHQLDGLALTAASEYEAVLLSPVAPLGSCSVVAPTSQDRTLTTNRGSEVVSDPTNLMALLSAERLGKDPGQRVQLCTVHQTLRAQPLPPLPGYSRHFRLLALTEAGPARAEDGFEVDAVTRAIVVFDRLFDAAASALGCRFPERRASVRTTGARETLGRRLADRLASTLPHVRVVHRPLDQPYYNGLRVMFGADSTAGEHVAIGDVGLFDWVAKLTANRRQRFVAAGFGLQQLPLVFR
jgi:hypothetical protein